jgi:hypothetical protein
MSPNWLLATYRWYPPLLLAIRYQSHNGKACHVPCRTEEAIREYFKSGGKVMPKVAPPRPRIPAADPALVAKWFPGLELSKTACANPR